MSIVNVVTKTVEVVDKVTVELSLKEAQDLRAVLGKLTGRDGSKLYRLFKNLRPVQFL